MVVGGGVVGGDVVQVELDAVALLDQVAGACHDGQGGQPQEVHLEQAQRVEHAHLELGDGLDRAIFSCGAGWAVQRHVLHQRLVGDHHAGGVGAGVAHHAFHLGWRCRSALSGSLPTRTAA